MPAIAPAAPFGTGRAAPPRAGGAAAAHPEPAATPFDRCGPGATMA